MTGASAAGGYPAEALATFNTHDMPSFRGWLDGHDLRVKRAIGVDPGESDEARAWAQQKLRDDSCRTRARPMRRTTSPRSRRFSPPRRRGWW